MNPGQEPPVHPPASVPRRRRRIGLTIAIVAAVLATLTGGSTYGAYRIGLLGGDARTEQGAMAAEQRGIDLLTDRRYEEFYDGMDSESKKLLTKDDFVFVAKCLDVGGAMAKARMTVVSAVVSGDTATVRLDSASGSTGERLTYQSGRWRYSGQLAAGERGSPADMTTGLLLLRSTCT